MTATTLSSVSDEKLKKFFSPEKEEKDSKKVHILVPIENLSTDRNQKVLLVFFLFVPTLPYAQLLPLHNNSSASSSCF